MTFALALTVAAAHAADSAADDAAPPGETVDVTANRPDGPDPANTSASVTVLTPDARTPASADVASLIESAAGTEVDRLGGLGDFAAVSIRGASLRQVEVFLDGIPLNPDGASVVDLSELPLGAFSRIEVWRGNAPISFGASPIGGVVNLVTKHEPGGRASAAYGSWDTARADVYAAGVTSGAGPRFDGQAFVDVLQSRDDFRYFADNATIYNVLDDHIPTRANNDKLQLAGFARGGASRGNWRFSVADAPLFRDEGLPGIANLPTETARLTTTRNLVVGQAEGCGAAWTSTITAWNLYRAEELLDLDGELDGTARQEVDTLQTYGARLGGTWAPTGWIVPSATVGARRESIVVDERLGAEADPERTRVAASGALSADLRAFADRLLVSPVVAGELLDNSALGESADTQSNTDPNDQPLTAAVNPRLGILVKPWPFLVLKANGGHYLRPPDLTELFGNHGTLEGNAALRPESGWQADVGARFELPSTAALRFTADTAAFWLVSTDRIIWVQNSQRSFTPVNFGDTWVSGVEASVSLSAFNLVDSDTSITAQLSRNLTEGSSDANNELPRVSPLSVWESLSVHWEERVRAGYTFSYAAPNFWDAANLYQSAPRTLHGAFVRVQPTPKWPRLELSGLNLADTITEVVPRNPADPSDTSRAVTAVTDFSGYPLPGRTFLLDLSWDL